MGCVRYSRGVLYYIYTGMNGRGDLAVVDIRSAGRKNECVFKRGGSGVAPLQLCRFHILLLLLLPPKRAPKLFPCSLLLLLKRASSLLGNYHPDLLHIVLVVLLLSSSSPAHAPPSPKMEKINLLLLQVKTDNCPRMI